MARCGCSSVGATGAAMTGTDCVGVSGAGTPASPFEVELILADLNDNLLECTALGLYARAPVQAAADDSLLIVDGANLGDYDYSVQLDAATGGNQLVLTAGEGLHVPLFSNFKMIGVGNAVLNGAPPDAEDTIWQVQEGTTVGTTDGLGHFTVTYPASFPTGVLSAEFTLGDIPIVDSIVMIDHNSHTLNSFEVVVVHADSTGPVVGGQYRVNWRVVGW